MTEQMTRTVRRFEPGGQSRPETRPNSRPQLLPASAVPVSALRTPARQPAPEAGLTLSRLWLDALADEERHVAPFERMATALFVFGAAVSLLVAGSAVSQLLERWDTFASFVQRLVL